MLQNLGYFEKHHYFIKNWFQYFLTTLRKILGYFLFQYLVTLVIVYSSLN